MILVQTSKKLIGQDYTAYLINLIANTLWALGLLIGTQNKHINYVYMGLMRGLAILLLAIPMAKLNNIRIDFPCLSDLKILNVRNLIMTSHGFFFAMSFHYLQAPVVYTISNAGPIIVYVIDYFMYSVQVHRRQLIGIIVSFVGIVLAINSHLIYRQLGFEQTTGSQFEYEKVSLQAKLGVGVLFLIATIFWAYGIVITKKLKKTTTLQVSVHQGFTLTFVNAIAIFILPNPETIGFEEEIYLFLEVGLLMGFSSGLYIASLFVTEKSGNVTIVGFSTVFFGYLVSMVRYKQTPNLIGMVGSLCIGIGLVCVLLR